VETETNPVGYRIVVKGRLTEALGSAFGDMRLDTGPGRTTLTGDFTDQAQLQGVLKRLQDFGIELVSVNPTEEADR